MRLSSHLKKSRHGIYYFRLVIPDALRPCFGCRKEIRKSLGTREPSLAKLYAYSLYAQFGPLLDRLKKAMKKNYDPSKFDPSNPATWPGVENANSRYKLRHGADGIEIETDSGNPDDHKNAMEALKSLKDSGFYELLAEKLKFQAEAEAHAKALEHHSAERAELLAALAGSRAENTVQTSQPITIKEGIENYLALAQLTPKSAQDYKSVLVKFSIVFGPQKLVSQVDRIAINQYMIWAKENLKIGDRTLDKHLGFIRCFLAHMQSSGYYAPGTLPVDGQYQMTASERKKTTPRLPFNEENLKTLFDPGNLLPLESPHAFWVPILGLFTGARLGELAQLQVSDFREIDGLRCIAITDQDDDDDDDGEGEGNVKSLKTTQSKRDVPLHPQLIALGLLDYIQDVRALHGDKARIFPYLTFHPTNGYGAKPGKDFRAYRRSLGITTTRKVFHSFRHTVNHRLIDNGIHLAERCQLIGHVYDGTSTVSFTSTNEAVYGKRIPLPSLNKCVSDQWLFPEIEEHIPRLRYPKGRFVSFLMEQSKRKPRVVKVKTETGTAEQQ